MSRLYCVLAVLTPVIAAKPFPRALHSNPLGTRTRFLGLVSRCAAESKGGGGGQEPPVYQDVLSILKETRSKQAQAEERPLVNSDSDQKPQVKKPSPGGNAPQTDVEELPRFTFNKFPSVAAAASPRKRQQPRDPSFSRSQATHSRGGGTQKQPVGLPRQGYPPKAPGLGPRGGFSGSSPEKRAGGWQRSTSADAPGQQSYSRPFVQSTGQQQQQQRQGKLGGVYASWRVYKGKGAINVFIRPPQWTVGLGNALFLEKEGGITLEFAEADPNAQRSYKWGEKTLFCLSVSEMGSILSLQHGESLEFYHDPNKGSNTPGKVQSKILRFQPANAAGSLDYFLSLESRQPDKTHRVRVPLTPGEIAVFRELIRYALPRILGADRVLGSAFNSVQVPAAM